MEEIIFPNQIRTYRKKHGCTMQELADELEMSLSAISKIEKGYRRLDQEQLMHVAAFLNCHLQDLFVNELNSNPEVVQAWKKEQERRSKINVNGGLKTLGAGLRQIRNEKDLTLIEVAKDAGMTLSVYHRIEMGQREVSDKEFNGIAKALSVPVASLKEMIKKLDERGVLNEIIQKNDAKYRSLATPKGSTNSDSSKIFVYDAAEDGKNVYVDITEPTEKIAKPYYLQNKVAGYAVRFKNTHFDTLLPSNALMFVDPSAELKDGDMALYYKEYKKAVLVKIEGHKASLKAVLSSGKSLKIGEDTKIHKIIVISL